MTVQEVKKRLEALHYRILHNVFCNKVHNAELEALNIAIESMEEVEQYRALGTVEELKEAREMNKNCTIEQLTGVECSYNETGCSDCKGKQALLEAMEKQIPIKIKEIHVDEYYCPACGVELNCNDAKVEDKYCSECGQRFEVNEDD